jgi:hypothetical protein
MSCSMAKVAEKIKATEEKLKADLGEVVELNMEAEEELRSVRFAPPRSASLWSGLVSSDLISSAQMFHRPTPRR